MKIISYNINGYRAAQKKGLENWLSYINADIIGFQEVKANKNQVNLELIEKQKYYVYWNSAEKKGYSGVVFFVKKKPNKVTFGLNNKIDNEGRVITLFYNNIVIINSYFPSGASSTKRQSIKMNFLKLINNHINEVKETNKNIIILGDFNIAHLNIDIHNPIKYKGIPGFTNEERKWFDNILKNHNLLDTFRYFNNLPNKYSWWSYINNSRNRNVGWRIDYILCSNSLKNKLKNSRLLTIANHSDHCPILTKLNFCLE